MWARTVKKMIDILFLVIFNKSDKSGNPFINHILYKHADIHPIISATKYFNFKDWFILEWSDYRSSIIKDQIKRCCELLNFFLFLFTKTKEIKEKKKRKQKKEGEKIDTYMIMMVIFGFICILSYPPTDKDIQ